MLEAQSRALEAAQDDAYYPAYAGYGGYDAFGRLDGARRANRADAREHPRDLRRRANRVVPVPPPVPFLLRRR
jgi:hypothetical protein